MAAFGTLWLRASLALLWVTCVVCDEQPSEVGETTPEQELDQETTTTTTTTCNWPEQNIGMKTKETVTAGKKASKWIACEVCTERLLALFPPEGDNDQIEMILEMGLAQWLSDAKALCDMKNLAQLFSGRRMEIKVFTDGSAGMERIKGDPPFYNETNDNENEWHWKSFALQHACLETFRKNSEKIGKTVSKAYRKLAKKSTDAKATVKLVYTAVIVACQQVKVCKNAAKLIEAYNNRTVNSTEERVEVIPPHTEL
mmetsp:Transcript_81716/g.154319  ORF Transcript_81716/g.154319 Transcript_81716/m.154319 type:complete len:256 (+) Transcript_81716:32-799(+)